MRSPNCPDDYADILKRRPIATPALKACHGAVHVAIVIVGFVQFHNQIRSGTIIANAADLASTVSAMHADAVTTSNTTAKATFLICPRASLG
jgi:hypothetical protein